MRSSGRRSALAAVGVAAAVAMQSPDGLAQSEDACHALFVQCVAEHGYPPDCLSVRNACAPLLETEPRRADFEEAVSIRQADGAAFADMTLRNIGTKPASVGVRRVLFQCPDGREEAGFFRFDTEFGPGDSATTSGGVVCFGQANARLGPDAVEEIVATPGGQSLASLAIACDPGGERMARLDRLPADVIRYETADGVVGTARLSDVDSEGLAALACTPAELQTPGVIERIKAELRPFLEWLGDEDRAPSRSVGTVAGGSRN